MESLLIAAQNKRHKNYRKTTIDKTNGIVRLDYV